MDKRILQELNSGAFRGHIINSQNVGKTGDDLVVLWDEEHPDDPVT